MKKIILIMSLVLIIVLSGCSDNIMHTQNMNSAERKQYCSNYCINKCFNSGLEMTNIDLDYPGFGSVFAYCTCTNMKLASSVTIEITDECI